MIIRNKYNSACVVCKTSCKSGNGWAMQDQNRYWVVYCDNHAPKMEQLPATRREITADGHIYMPYEADNLPLLRSFPGAKWDRDNKCWQVSLLDCDRVRILELSIRLGLTIAPELCSIKMSEEASSASNTEGLYPYQVSGVDWLSKGSKRLLGDEMGLGKGVQALFALPKNGKVIVVCPAGLKYNWYEEALRWRDDYTPVVLEGKESFRLPEEGEIIITSYNILPKEFEPIEEDGGNKWDIRVDFDPKELKKLSDCILIVMKYKRLKTIRQIEAKELRDYLIIARRFGL